MNVFYAGNLDAYMYTSLCLWLLPCFLAVCLMGSLVWKLSIQSATFISPCHQLSRNDCPTESTNKADEYDLNGMNYIPREPIRTSNHHQPVLPKDLHGQHQGAAKQEPGAKEAIEDLQIQDRACRHASRLRMMRSPYRLQNPPKPENTPQ